MLQTSILKRFISSSKIPIISSRTISQITGGQVVYNQLLKHQVKDVFLYSGGAAMPLIDCFYDGQINYFINTHEQNCGHAATGYARSSNKTGVVIVTSGPGLTNLVTPILDAQNDSTPLVVISGQVPLAAMGTQAFQECPATDITRSITKWSHCVQETDDLETIIEQAFYIANDKKKGAVHIDIPKCILAKKYIQPNDQLLNNPMKPDNNSKSQKFHITGDFQNQIDKVASIINQAQKPIFYIGQGCNNASKSLTKMVLNSNIPITTTIHAVGVFDENHPLSMKFLGMHGSAAANYAIQQSDCIIAIGSRFDDRTTGNLQYYAPEAKKAALENRGGIIHVDIEPQQINKVVQADYHFNCDSEIFINCLSRKLISVPRNKWIKQCQQWKHDYPFKYDILPDNQLKTQDVIKEINSQLYELNLIDNTIITTGVGNHQMMAAQFIQWKQSKSMITSGSLGVMGVGLPYAIGCQIAKPNKLVLDIDGDGSFNHTLSDLKTAVEENLPIKIAIMNDGYQSMVRVWEELFYDNRITATKLKRNPDYTMLAESFGMMSLKVESRQELASSIEQFLTYPGPILCEFKVKTDNCFPLVAPGKALDDLILHQDMTKSFDLQNQLPPN